MSGLQSVAVFCCVFDERCVRSEHSLNFLPGCKATFSVNHCGHRSQMHSVLFSCSCGALACVLRVYCALLQGFCWLFGDFLLGPSFFGLLQLKVASNSTQNTFTQEVVIEGKMRAILVVHDDELHPIWALRVESRDKELSMRLSRGFWRTWRWQAMRAITFP